MATDWGDIGGTLSNQTDLQAALDSKLEFSGTDYDVLTWKDDEVVGSSTRNRDAATPQIFNDHVGMARGARLMWASGSSVPFSIDTSSIYFIQGSVDAGPEEVAARGISSRLYLTDTPGTGNILRYGMMAVVQNEPGTTVTINNGTNNNIQAAHCIVQTNNGSHFGFALGVVGGADNDNGTMGTGIGGDFRTANIGENTSTDTGYAIRAVVGNYANGASHQDAAFLHTRLRFGGTGEITGKLIGVDFGGLTAWDDGPCAESYMIYFGESCAVGDEHWAIYGEDDSGNWRCGGDLKVQGAVQVEGRVKVVAEDAYTLQEEDWGRVLVFTANETVGVFLPAGLPVGFECDIIQRSADGRVVIGPQGGATLVSPVGSSAETTGDAARARLLVWNDATTTDWIASGDLQAFDPLSISDMLCWYDASDPSTLFDAVSGGSPVGPDDPVARWNDKSGNANNATQATSAERPIRRIDVQNGNGVLEFDGNTTTNISLRATGAVLAGNEATVFAVLRATTLVNYRSAIRFQADNNGYLVIPWGNSGQRAFITSVDGGTSGGISSGAVANEWNVLTGMRIRDGDPGLSTWRNGVAVDETSTTDTALYSTYLFLGRTITGTSDPFNGNMAEVFVFLRGLTNGERTAMDGYLIGKWGI